MTRTLLTGLSALVAVALATAAPVGAQRGAGKGGSGAPPLSKSSAALLGDGLGGFEELASSTSERPRRPARDIAEVIPGQRGPFRFPPPYHSLGYRLTVPSDCGGDDCVNSVGYSYWRNINNHTASDRLLVFLTLSAARGGVGPSIFELNKRTGAVRARGPLFGANDPRRRATGEGWYFSASADTMLYALDGPRLTRIDVLSRASRVVVDLDWDEDIFGRDRSLWQAHSSNDDAVHSFTIVGDEALGCGVYLERTGEFRFYPTFGRGFDECQIDRSGDWLLIKEQIDDRNGEDNRIIHVPSGDERWLFDEDGAGGHSDMGFGAMIAADNWSPTGMAWRLWEFASHPLGPRTIVYSDPSWHTRSIDHVSWLNAVDGAPGSQYACGSGVNRGSGPRVGEIVCFRLDGSLRTIVVAPVMTDLDAAGGESEYWRLPKGNLDVTGEYFIWTANGGGDRLDAYIVRIPVERLEQLPARRFAAPRGDR
jgi:hypothetical protein